MTDDVEVSVWSYRGLSWELVGSTSYTSIEFEPRDRDAGPWTMTLPHGAQSDKIRRGRLVTTKFRGDLRTWTINPKVTREDEDEGLVVTVSGFDAISLLERATCWPSPTLALADQGAQASYTGPAETVIRSLIKDNLRDRYGLAIDIPASAGLGGIVTSNPRFDNLLTEVLRVAKVGKIGVRVGLVPQADTSTRANLALWFYEPQDKTLRVRLASSDGSLGAWELTENPPTATKAVVGGSGEGAGQYLHLVTTTDSAADAASWGGEWEVFVDGTETFDDTTLDADGQKALADGAASVTLTMEAQEPAGTKAFQAFQVGDLVTALPYPGLEIPDVVSGISVSHETGDPLVTPKFGDPDSGDADSENAARVRRLDQLVRSIQTNRKRGTV